MMTGMIGAHFLMYSRDPDADRAFLKDALGFPFVDAGHGWLIFALPPSEMGVHPAEGDVAQQHAEQDLARTVLYLLCDDVHAVVKSLGGKNVHCSSIDDAPWGIKTTIRLPSGGHIGLYQPKHPTALGL